MSANQDLVTLLRARTPLLVIESAEEGRVIRHAFAQSLRPLFSWSITQGLKRLDMDADAESEEGSYGDASQMLGFIKQHGESAVFLLLDFQPYLRYPMALRLMREIVLRQAKSEHTLALVGARYELPDDLVPLATPFQLALPDIQAMAALQADVGDGRA